MKLVGLNIVLIFFKWYGTLMDSMDQIDDQAESYSQIVRAARVFAIISFSIGLCVFMGQIFSINQLNNFLLPWPTGNVSSAVGYIAASIGLFLQCQKNPSHLRKQFSAVLALFLIALGALSYLQQLLSIHVNPMSLANAVNFILFGFSLLLVDTEFTEVIRPSQFLAIGSALLPLHNIIFYAYGVETKGGSYLAITQLEHSAAVVWLCLSLGALLVRPDKGLVRPFGFDQEISSTWRSILLTGVIIPVMLGFIFSLGYRKGYYGPEFGFSILAIASILMIAFFVWRSANHNWQVSENKLDVDNKIKQALRLRDEFLSIASHELKTPLTLLSLQAQISKLNLLRSGSNTLTKEQLLIFLTKMDSQIFRLAQLVEDMVDISRIDSGRFTPVLKSTDVKQLVNEVVDQLGTQIVAAECQLTISIPNSITAEWDSYRIEQVLINLITNAIKYGEKKPVIIEAVEEENCAIVSVKDHGIGIAKENQQRIFNRFERAVSAKGITGLGLGLYIVKQILDSHRGEITVESELNQGSKFTVKLPLKPGSIASPVLQLKDTNYGISS